MILERSCNAILEEPTETRGEGLEVLKQVLTLHVCLKRSLYSDSNSLVENLGKNYFTMKRKRDFRLSSVAKKRLFLHSSRTFVSKTDIKEDISAKMNVKSFSLVSYKALVDQWQTRKIVREGPWKATILDKKG